MNTCPLCKERGKDWTGDDPVCAFTSVFEDSRFFTKNNWNCATMNALRQIAEQNEVCRDDEYVGVVPFGDGFIVMTWYKRRGNTANAIVMSGAMPIKKLTLKIAEQALKEVNP